MVAVSYTHLDVYKRQFIRSVLNSFYEAVTSASFIVSFSFFFLAMIVYKCYTKVIKSLNITNVSGIKSENIFVNISLEVLFTN